MASLDELHWEREYRRCRGDGTVDGDLEAFAYFCRRYVWIQHPRGRRLFALRQAQIDTVRSYLEHDQELVLKARQIGFTTVTMVFALWQAVFHADFTVINLSKKEDDAKKALAKASYAWDQMDRRFRSRLPQRTNDNLRVMMFSNGSMIESHPSQNNPARGSSASLMVLDEWAFMPDPDEAWAAVEPVADVGGKIIALSTANGVGNLFHSMWVDAERGANQFHNLFFPWSALPERDDAWYALKKRSMAEWQLHQEYPSSPDEAFIRSGNAVFDLDKLQAMRTRRPMRGELVQGESDRITDFRWVEASEGSLSVYETPVPDGLYVIGADTAAGLEHQDHSSAHVLRVDQGPETQVVAHWHGDIDPDQFAEVLARLGWWYRKALLGVEANNHGSTTLTTLVRYLKYPRVYRRRAAPTSRYDKPQEQYGWWTSRASKPQLVDGLGAMIRDAELVIPDRPTIAELRSYVRKPDGTTTGSPHDDRVMSLGVAVQMIPFARGMNAPSPEKSEVGTFKYHLKRLKKAGPRDLIGAHNRSHLAIG